MAVIGTALPVGTGREAVRGQNGRRIYVRPFIVQTDSPFTASKAVMDAPLLPRMYEPYQTSTESDMGALVRSVIPRQRDNSRLLWDVNVTYDSEFERLDNPYTEPIDIVCDSEVYDQPLPGRAAIFYDPYATSPQSEDPLSDDHEDEAVKAWGQGIVTSAGEPFDPPPVSQRSRPIVRFTRNQADFSVAVKVLYENTVNRYPWSGLQARQAWLRSIIATSHVFKSTTVGQADIFYFRVEYVFALKVETWDLQLLDIGSYYLDYSSGQGRRRAFKVKSTGEPRLGLLDHLDPAQPGKKLPEGAPAQFLRWRQFREVDYNPLGINLNLALADRKPRKR